MRPNLTLFKPHCFTDIFLAALGIEPDTSGSVANNYDHKTTDEVITLSLPAHDYLPREYIDVSYQIESPGDMQSDMFQLYPELEQAFRAKPLEPYEKNHLQQEADKDYILSESPKTDISGANEDNFYDIPLGIPDEYWFKMIKILCTELLVPPQEEGSVDPLEVAGLFQGDIAGVNISDLVLERNAIRDLGLRWSRGIVPYVISASFSVYERSVIAAAFLDYHQHSCIKFVPRTTQQDYVYLLKGAGNSGLVLRSAGRVRAQKLIAEREFES
uniref:Peptidase M12A domain-containing protein n=2 Tax=Timema TaxID=61471 RepID=A0A7R9CW39_TIMCR|nr:unnamed protein product [Timema cristinae]